MMDFAVGVLTAALAGMGVGGGGLLVLYLVLIKEMEQISAQGINLVFFIVASAVAFLYNRKKRSINYRLCVLLIICGAVGAFAGALTANVLDPQIVRKVFGWLLIISGIYALLSDRIEKIKKLKKGLTKKN